MLIIYIYIYIYSIEIITPCNDNIVAIDRGTNQDIRSLHRSLELTK